MLSVSYFITTMQYMKQCHISHTDSDVIKAFILNQSSLLRQQAWDRSKTKAAGSTTEATWERDDAKLTMRQKDQHQLLANKLTLMECC